MKIRLKNLFSYTCITCVFLLTLYILQGAFYRFSEPYALARLQFAWEGQGGIGKLLKFFSIDHFTPSPVAQKIIHEPQKLLQQEDYYARRIMNFTRPIRDDYRKFIDKKKDLSNQLLIDDLGMIKNVVLPNLSRLASYDDVQKGFAKKFGMPVKFAKGLVIFLFKKSNLQAYYKKFNEYEPVFHYLSQKGLACVLLEVANKDELLGQVDHLKINFGQLCPHIFAYAEDDLASLLMEASFSRPYSFSGIVVKDVQTSVPEPLEGGSTWFLGLVSQNNNTIMPKYRTLLKWCWSGRSSPYHYPSRLGGLIRYASNDIDLPFSEFATSYLLTAVNYSQHAEGGLNNPNAVNLVEDNSTMKITLEKSLGKKYSDSVSDVDVSLKIKTEPYQCDIIEQYRLMHVNDPLVSKISNRDLIIKLGKSFESMGEDILWQISKKDPIFYEHYKSLRLEK